MAEGNEVSRSSTGPIGEFPLNPPWQEEEKMKPAVETKPDMWKLADKYAALDKIKNNIPINAPLYQQRVYKEKIELDVKIENLRHYRMYLGSGRGLPKYDHPDEWVDPDLSMMTNADLVVLLDASSRQDHWTDMKFMEAVRKEIGRRK